LEDESSIRTKKESKYIVIQIIIEDNGIGISEPNIDKLFKDFSRLEEHE